MIPGFRFRWKREREGSEVLHRNGHERSSFQRRGGRGFLLKGVRTPEKLESRSGTAGTAGGPWGEAALHCAPRIPPAGMSHQAPPLITRVVSAPVLRILGVASWIALEVWRFPGQVVWESMRAIDSEMMGRRTRNERPRQPKWS